MHVDLKPKTDDEWWTYLVDYEHDGETYSVYVRAPSYEDAEARLQSIAQGAVKGRMGGYIDIPLPENTPKPVLMVIGHLLMRSLGFRKGKE